MNSRIYTIHGQGPELPRWRNSLPRGSPMTELARAVMWGGYTHLQKGITQQRVHTVKDLDT